MHQLAKFPEKCIALERSCPPHRADNPTRKPSSLSRKPTSRYDTGFAGRRRRCGAMAILRLSIEPRKTCDRF
ncbi:hypothetical protein B9Z19DRAFT_1071906 [Tuber borchii]|uniref:Uncharacterized protein n=1 Tax=Tuber borchii TaxID=42251 RepID=A0A2T7A7G7_TUBBO|nr:hypothetical protein B9Z19DRAFT_1071906 [Tuber borchii]